MKHTSVKLNSPIEFINITPVNPLISKCEIKVCYVDDKPNRNGTIITKETAIKLAQSLPGSPIVGYYAEAQKDFEEHNRIIKISNGEFLIDNSLSVLRICTPIVFEVKFLSIYSSTHCKMSRVGTKFFE